MQLIHLWVEVLKILYLAEHHILSLVGGDGCGVSGIGNAILGGKRLNTLSGVSWDYAAVCGIGNSTGHYPWDNLANIPPQQQPGTCYRFIVGTGEISGDNDNGFVVDNSGNLNFGNNSGGCSIFVQNNSSKYDFKAFTIDHPEDDDKFLVHGCLEGPEGGVYYRGKDTAPVTVKLPSYVTKIAKNFTVQVTPIGQPRLLGVDELTEEGTFDVHGEGRFHWLVMGERVKIDTEPIKKNTKINRFGPYTWTETYP